MSEYVRAEYTPLFTQVQDIIADSLNSDPQLSSLGITFYPEHNLEIEYEIKKNLGQQGIVGIVNTLKGFYGGHNGNTNAWEIEAEIDVVENPTIRRAQMKKMGLSAGSTADIIDWVQESLCGPSSPSYGKFCAQQQQLGEDSGLIVGKSIVKTFAIADVSAIVSGEHMWHCPYALASDLEDLSGLVYDMDVKVDWLDVAVKELSAEISGGGEIWEVVGDLSSEVSGLSVQMGNKADLSSLNNYLPLKITNPTEISGNAYLDFNCLTRFQRPVVMNGALDVLQLNIVNYDVDSYTSLSAIDEDTIGFVGGFNREHTAVLNLKNGTIAYTSDMPSKTSDLTNDSGFLTSAQVVPSTNLGMTGYAANSEYATKLNALDTGTVLPTDRGKIIPTLTYDSATNAYTLDLYGSVAGYYPWDLHRLFGTDFSPVIRLEWRKGTIWRKRVIGGTVRWSVVYNNNWMWLAKGQYAITCPTGDGKPDGNFYVLNYEDETHPNYINDPATDVNTITYGNYDITSIDGQAGGQQSQTIWCSRTNANPVTIWERPFAYRNEIPTKTSDLTNDSDFITNTALSAELALKQNKLSNAQTASINSVVDERTTYFTFPNNEIQSVYVEGRLDTYYLQELNPVLTHQKILTATEVKIGRSVTEIGYGAFNGCSNLAKVTIPDSVVTIEEMAFGQCYALARIEIPDGVSAISNLFNYTDVHADIVFGKGIQSISEGMFHYVSPNSVTFIGKTMAEVQAMTYYPWDIEDTSIIKTYNVASQEWTEQNYFPLSGDATANVVTDSLSADAIITGHPNTSGTIGPDEEGNHYSGVYVQEGYIDIQKSVATQTVDWYGTKIDGRGRITQKEKDFDAPVITYDELKLPKTQSNSTRTIATEEWVLEQLAALSALLTSQQP